MRARSSVCGQAVQVWAALLATTLALCLLISLTHPLSLYACLNKFEFMSVNFGHYTEYITHVQSCTCMHICVRVWAASLRTSKIYKLLMELINSKPNHPLAHPARLYYLYLSTRLQLKWKLMCTAFCLWNGEHMLTIYRTYLETFHTTS